MAQPSPGPGAKSIKEELDKDNRDVADLWSEALRKYKGISGTELQPKFKTVDDMIAFGTQEMNAFHKFRHNQKKVDKLRGLFMANIGYIEKGAQQLIAAATPAFPPAAAIGTALTYVLSACKAVSADYDVVVAFFEDLSAFLQRITILESRLPKYPAYRNCLMDVFSSLLSMCGFATKYIELGRFKKWVINLVGGQDGELSGARATMDKQLSRLQSATEFAILGNTEEIQRMNVDLQQNQDLQTQMMEEQTKMLSSVVESQQAVRNDLKNIQKLLTMFENQRREDPTKKVSKAATQGKSPTSLRVRNFFQDMLDPMMEYRNIKDQFVPDTCQWIFEEGQWDQQTIRTEEPARLRILTLSGPTGVGKSHLAVSAYDHLLKNADSDTCVAHFYFRTNRSQDLRTFANAINWIVIQAAEQNAAICERLNVELAREDRDIDTDEWKDVWTSLVVPIFSQGRSHLQIVWDGLDELEYGWKDDLLDFFDELKTAVNLNLSIVCTARQDQQIDEKLNSLSAEYIQVSKEKQATDFQTLIWSHLNNDEGLKRFSKYGKQTIVSALVEKSDVLLYAEEILRQFNVIRREPLVLKQLDQLSGSWRKLYEFMLHELEGNTPEHQKTAVQILLYWLSFSYDTLTLDQCMAVLAITGHGDFDLERQLQGNNLTKFLRLADAEEREEDDVEADELDLSSLDNSTTELITTDGDVPLRFHHRSMMAFCSSGQAGDGTIRTPHDQAQREIFKLSSSIMSGEFGDGDVALRAYGSRYWAFHLSWSNIPAANDEEKISAIHALSDIVLDRNGASIRMEKYGVDYDEQGWDFDDMAKQCFSFVAVTITELADKLDRDIVTWAENVVKSTENAYVPLTKAHITNWLRGKDLDSLQVSYKFARTCAKLTDIKDRIVDDDDDDEDDENEDEDEESYALEEITGLYSAFEDTPKDAHACWAVAALLLANEHHEEAGKYAQQALNGLEDAAKIVETMYILANAQLGQDDHDAAIRTVGEALELPGTDAKLKRKLFVTEAEIHVALGNVDAATHAYGEARAANEDEPIPGGNLSDEIQLYLNPGCDQDLMTLVKSWKVTEQLTCMTWKLDEGFQHDQFYFAAGRCGEQDVMFGIYEDVLKLLDTVKAGPPVRYRYALARWSIAGDVEGAKALMHEILEMPSDGWPYKFSNVEPLVTLGETINDLSDIIYEQYRLATDRKVKQQLFDEIGSLESKPMTLSISLSKTDTLHHKIKTARMSRKMSSAIEYHDQLNNAFETCYEALIDTVGWNDWQNIINLALIVSQLDGLEDEARILLSAMFSELDGGDENGDGNGNDGEDADHDEANVDGSNVVASREEDAVEGAEQDDDDDDDDKGSDDDDEDDEEDDDEEGEEKEEQEGEEEQDDEENGDDAEEDDSPPTDEGDLNDVTFYCAGDCNPRTYWQYWKGRDMHLCLTCRNTPLCSQCYQKRLDMNSDPSKCPVKGRYFCGKGHKYVQAPVEGWKGITNGIMRIEGEEDVEVEWKVWLEELRNEKWVKAWERFWTEED